MKDELVKMIRELQCEEQAPSGKPFNGISVSAVNRIAEATSISRREVEISALENNIIPIRYHRNIGSLGIDGQLMLLKSNVAVTGAGGLGGCIIELLARFGVGRMVVIDAETFTEDNLNRQFFATESNIGENKAEAAIKRVKQINSSVEIEAKAVFMVRDNIKSLLKGSDLIMDALDNIPVRLLLQDASSELGIPMIHGAIAGFVGEVMTVFPGEIGLRSFFKKGVKPPEKGIEVEVGTPTVTVAFIATLEVMEAVKILTRKGRPIENKLLCVDLEELKSTEIGLEGGEMRFKTKDRDRA